MIDITRYALGGGEMAERKDQHYVPQMYFRNFSENGKSISGLVLKSHKYVADMPIAGICKREYLYGSDLQIEKWFSELENQWAPILKKIIAQGNLQLTEKEWSLLLYFIYLSDVRTGYAADSYDDVTTKVLQVKMLTERNKATIPVSDEQIKQMKMRLEIPNLYSIKAVDKMVWIMGDLAPVLIHNKSSRQFITSDNPVVKYNYLFAVRNYHCNYGYGHLGLQIYIPISPEYCLLTYDPNVYSFSQKNDVIEINSSDQIIELNKLFARNAKSAVYCSNSAREWVVQKYAANTRDTSKIFNNHILQNRNGEYMIQMSSPSILNKYRLSFCKIFPMMLEIQFPSNLAGPLRPDVQKIQSVEESKLKAPKDYPTDSLFRYLPDYD